MEGNYFERLASATVRDEATVAHLVRLTNSVTGTRDYVFNTYISAIDTLKVWMSVSTTPDGSVRIDKYPSYATVYTGTETIRSVSATVLNDVFYIAIGLVNSGRIAIITTTDMTNFVDRGYVTDSNNVPIQTTLDFTLFAAASPDPAQVGGALYLYHACPSCVPGAFAARVIRAVSVTTTPIIFGLNTAMIVNDLFFATMTGTASAVAIDYNQVLLVRSGSQSPTGRPVTIWWCLLNTTQSTRTGEFQLIDYLTGDPALTSFTPAVIFDRFAGDAALTGTAAIMWSNYGDNLLYSFVGYPFG